MKGKKILTLASLAMGVAIVGATFAAWAVTDNADPFGIKVSPGKVGPDQTQFVTLSYGSSTFANVDNLEAGVARLAGSVLLKADTSDGTMFPYAVFDIELKDQSGTKPDGAAKLVDLLNVDVYDVAITKDPVTGAAVIPDGAEPIGHIPTEDGKLKASVPVEIPHETGLPVYVVVSLDEDTDAKTLEDIAKDVVYLQMDLNKAESGDYTTASKLYINQAVGADESMYIYAWSDKNKNANWPGVEMEYDAALEMWSYDLKTEFTNVIFSIEKEQGDQKVATWQTVDLLVDHAELATKPVFTPGVTPDAEGKYTGSWGKLPDPDIVKGYYVVGDHIGTGDFTPVKETLMTVDATNEKHYTKEMTFVAGEKIKVTNEKRTVWYSSVTPWDDCGFTIDEFGNLVVTAAGTYTVNLYLEGDGGNCLTLGLPLSD